MQRRKLLSAAGTLFAAPALFAAPTVDPEAKAASDTAGRTPQDPDDVLIIGAGGAGLSAAVEAANLGAKVVVVEKMAMAGGNTIRAAGGLNAPCTSLQAAKGVQDSLEIAYYDTMKGGHWKNDPELLSLIHI